MTTPEQTKEVLGWVPVTPKGRIVADGDGTMFHRTRSHGWLDDTKWKRAKMTITVLPDRPRPKPQTELMRWWNSLKPGDKVRIRQPWNDGKTPGGRVVQARVGRPHPFGTMIHYRRQDGRRFSELCRHPHASCYLTVMPLDRDVEYDYGPRGRGFFLRRKPK